MPNLIVREVSYNPATGKVTVKGTAPSYATVRVLVNPTGTNAMSAQQIYENYESIPAGGKAQKFNAGDFTIEVSVQSADSYNVVVVTSELKLDAHTAAIAEQVNQVITPG
ncbi:MAG TPA: hypothetical protein VKE40_05640 [Gemmataceae bacterium]|nr:hypothetical protein [Gemmataceae bacterium]